MELKLEILSKIVRFQKLFMRKKILRDYLCKPVNDVDLEDHIRGLTINTKSPPTIEHEMWSEIVPLQKVCIRQKYLKH